MSTRLRQEVATVTAVANALTFRKRYLKQKLQEAKRRRERRHAAGVCLSCMRAALPGSWQCAHHRALAKIRQDPNLTRKERARLVAKLNAAATPPAVLRRSRLEYDLLQEAATAAARGGSSALRQWLQEAISRREKDLGVTTTLGVAR
jgi:hypothetical protein